MKSYLRTSLALVLFAFTTTLLAQKSDVVRNSVLAKSLISQDFPVLNPFAVSELKNSSLIPNEISEASVLSLDEKQLKLVEEKDYNYLELMVPNPSGNNWTLQLEPNNIFTDEFTIKSSSGKVLNRADMGVFYRGVIKGNENSLASVSFVNGEVRAVISDENGNYNLGKMENSNLYVVYNEKELDKFKSGVCATEDAEVNVKELLSSKDQQKASERCVKIYFEVDYDVYQNKGNLSNTSNFIGAVFNEVATLYQNDGMVIKINELFIWDETSPYSASNSSGYLSDFRNYRTSFNGDIAHLVSLKSSYGGVAYVDVLCNQNYGYGWSGIRSNYSNVPTYSWTVEVVAHELGHQIGSPHTQSCSWPGGAIDDCYSTEGSCAPGPTPENGGTIMSYCHLTSTGINFNNGFGPLPSDLLRSKIASKSCITTCEVGPSSCDVPENLKFKSVTQTTATVEWDAAGFNETSFKVQYRKVGTVTWSEKSLTGEQLTVNGLSPATEYEFRVRANCAGVGESAYSQAVRGFTASPPSNASYCNSKGQNTGSEWISRVTFGEMLNSSGADGGYADYTNVEATIGIGTEAYFTLDPGFSTFLFIFRQTQPEYWRIWIDYNRDGDFDDANELAFDAQGTSTSRVTGNVNIPSNVLPGPTRMRVSMKRGSAPGACETFANGEVEDYTVNFVYATILSTEEETFSNDYLTSAINATNFTLAPNPTKFSKTKLKVNWSEEATEADLKVYTLSGRVLQTTSISRSQSEFDIDLQDLPAGVYMVNVKANDGTEKMMRLMKH